MLMLFSYRNIKEFLTKFSSSHLRRIKTSKKKLFHSEYSTTPFIISSAQFSSSAREKQLRNREIMRLAFLYLRHSPTIPSFPSCVVMYPTGSEIDSFVPLKRGEEKLIRNSCHFHTRTTRRFDEANKNYHMHFKLIELVEIVQLIYDSGSNGSP